MGMNGNLACDIYAEHYPGLIKIKQKIFIKNNFSIEGSTNQAELVANVPNNKMLKITKPDQGKWTANISLTAPNFNYFYRVFCESSIDFTYTLVAESGAPVEFSPIRGLCKFFA